MPRLAVEWKASGFRARGFYHADEDRLEVRTDRAGTFASFVDGEGVSFDLDRDGHLLGITVEVARDHWQVAPDLLAPRVGIPATVRIQNAPVHLGSVRLLTDPDYVLLRIELSPAERVHVVEACEGLLMEIGEGSELLAVWVLHIEDDFGCRRQRAWSAGQVD